jgi:hypothetical protein
MPSFQTVDIDLSILAAQNLFKPELSNGTDYNGTQWNLLTLDQYQFYLGKGSDYEDSTNVSVKLLITPYSPYFDWNSDTGMLTLK